MSDNDASAWQLSRRELIRLAGLGGLATAATGLTASLPLPALAASAINDTPEGFLAYAYARRDQVATTGNVSDLDPLYDPANVALLAHEKARAAFLRGGLGASGR